ncbi:hypothetical protein [Bradyrhizobium zhanjiangense]|uniref:hypothetical protein n=1 Tax=Bradyrhizobium zhanjiangense TaxID=1325107 RepID=UPI001FDEAEE7|nr:hypothetical protein [Bradyrhizobium zhanjiangense]
MLQHGAGKFPMHTDIEKYVYARGKGSTEPGKIGEVLYNRGMVNAMLGVEAIRKAQEKFGKKPLTGEQVRWGLENLILTGARIKELGFEGMLKPVSISCSDHEGARYGRVQQWDGKAWKVISDWYTADESLIEPLVAERVREVCRGQEDSAARLRERNLNVSQQSGRWICLLSDPLGAATFGELRVNSQGRCGDRSSGSSLGQ